MTDYIDLFNQHETDDLIRELNGNILWRYEPMNPDDTRPPVSSTAPFRAAERLKVMRWQPIETAPKDGTYFLAYWSSSEIKWHLRRYHMCHYAHGVIWPCYIYDDDPPTHWMPLPQPPKQENE